MISSDFYSLGLVLKPKGNSSYTDPLLGCLESHPHVLVGSLISSSSVTHSEEDKSTHPEGVSSHLGSKLPTG